MIRYVALLALALCALGCSKRSAPTATEAPPEAAAPVTFSMVRGYACADLQAVGLFSSGGGDMNAPTAPWGRDESTTTSPRAVWRDGKAFVEAMAASVAVDPPNDAATAAIASAVRRGPTPSPPGESPRFLLTPFGHIARGIAKARVGFTVDGDGYPDRIDVGLVDPVTDAGSGERQSLGLMNLATATCSLAPFGDVPKGAHVSFWFDRAVAGFDAGAIVDAWVDAENGDPMGGLRGLGLGPQDAGSAIVSHGTVTIVGGLPREVIERIVRQNMARVRHCYNVGLQASAHLAGRVAVKFVIDRTGAVSSAKDAGSDLPDAKVVSCIVHAFGSLSFPQPESGTVTVVYPVVFVQGA